MFSKMEAASLLWPGAFMMSSLVPKPRNVLDLFLILFLGYDTQSSCERFLKANLDNSEIKNLWVTSWDVQCTVHIH